MDVAVVWRFTASTVLRRRYSLDTRFNSALYAPCTLRVFCCAARQSCYGFRLLSLIIAPTFNMGLIRQAHIVRALNPTQNYPVVWGNSRILARNAVRAFPT
jgi:hypothetical protein